jgi:hypothetical protein
VRFNGLKLVLLRFRKLDVLIVSEDLQIDKA